MSKRMLLKAGLVWGGLCACVGMQAAVAQQGGAGNYPSRAVKIIVPYPAASSTDLLARAVAQKLQEKWGQPVLIENRPGAAGNLGTQLAINAPADGYTLVTGTVANTISATLFKNLGHDFQRDLAPVTQLAATPLGLFANVAVPFDNMAGLIDYARRNLGKVNFGSGGNGTSTHLSGEMLNQMANLKLVHVPYKGATAALADLLGGQIQIMFDTVTAQLQSVKSGKIKLIAVTSAKRMELLPNVPAVAETVPGFEAVGWQGLNVPAATPRPIIDKLYRDIAAILHDPAFKERFAASGATISGNTPEEYGAYIRAETTRWAAAVKASGATAD